MTRLRSALLLMVAGLIYVAQLWMFRGFHTDDA